MSITTTKTATLARTLDGFAGDARLYRLDPPMEHTSWDDERSTYEWVVVSAVVAMFGGPETYIFPATSEGEVASWGELEGSLRGALDHAAALAGAGYAVQP